MRWPPPLFLQHPATGWTVDCTAMHFDPADLEALPWDGVFTEMEALEGGSIANADEGRMVGHYWLRDPLLAPTVHAAEAIGEARRSVEEFARSVLTGEIAADDGLPFSDVLHVGIGGSALGPALVVDALGRGDITVHFVDNLDPDGIQRHLDRLGHRLRHTLVVVVTKSGGTPETRHALALVREALSGKGFHAPRHLVAITGPGSRLEQQAREEAWLATFPIWEWVGGRNSVTSAVGLLPAALAEVDVTRFLAGAREMDRWTRHASVTENPAALLAGAWYLAGNGRGDRAMVVLPYSDRLVLFSRHLQQLVMESLGKRLDRHGNEVHQGLTVYGNKGSTDQHAYVQQLRDGRNDFFCTFVQVLEDGSGSSTEVEDGVNAGDFLQGFLLGTRRALTESGRPSLTITVPRVEEETLGGLIALFERAVGFYATLVDLNAYHQPGVEAGKAAAKQILELSLQLRTLTASEPRSLAELVEETGADPTDVHYVLERLQHTGRLQRTDDRWHTP